MDDRLASVAAILVEVKNREEALTFDDPAWQEFFRINNLGLPLAMVVHYRLGELNDEGLGYLGEAWAALCGELLVDPEAEFDSFDHMLRISFCGHP